MASLEAAEKQEKDDDHKSESNASGGGISPLPAMRPSWQRPHERENQKYKQYHSKHDSLLLPCIPRLKFRQPLSWFIPVGLRPNANIREGMKKSENVQEPQDHADHHHGIQDRFDRPLHRDEVVDQPQQNTHYDQNHQQLKYRHRQLPPYFLGRNSAWLEELREIHC
jgi:hypothetical protein